MVEENKAIARRYTEAINAQDYDTLDTLCTPEVAQQVKELVQGINAIFEGHHITITDMIAKGDQVWARLASRGGHMGDFEGIPATGKQWTNTGVGFIRLVDGKVAEQDTLFDVVNHIRQVGGRILPPE